MTQDTINPVGNEIEVQPTRVAPLLPMDTGQAQQAMAAYQDLTGRLLTGADWIGQPGQNGSFVKRSGWQKIATFYGISTELLERRVERDQDGTPERAYVLVRASARDGRHADGDGGCATNEPRFRSASGRQKLEHDLPATAATRATNRAISNLVGFGAVSAEEVDADVRAGVDNTGQPKTVTPEWAAPVENVDRFGDALSDVLARAGAHDPDELTTRIGNALMATCDQTLPACCERLMRMLAQATFQGPPVPTPEDQ